MLKNPRTALRWRYLPDKVQWTTEHGGFRWFLERRTGGDPQHPREYLYRNELVRGKGLDRVAKRDVPPALTSSARKRGNIQAKEWAEGFILSDLEKLAQASRAASRDVKKNPPRKVPQTTSLRWKRGVPPVDEPHGGLGRDGSSTMREHLLWAASDRGAKRLSYSHAAGSTVYAMPTDKWIAVIEPSFRQEEGRPRQQAEYSEAMRRRWAIVEGPWSTEEKTARKMEEAGAWIDEAGRIRTPRVRGRPHQQDWSLTIHKWRPGEDYLQKYADLMSRPEVENVLRHAKELSRQGKRMGYWSWDANDPGVDMRRRNFGTRREAQEEAERLFLHGHPLEALASLGETRTNPRDLPPLQLVWTKNPEGAWDTSFPDDAEIFTDGLGFTCGEAKWFIAKTIKNVPTEVAAQDLHCSGVWTNAGGGLFWEVWGRGYGRYWVWYEGGRARSMGLRLSEAERMGLRRLEGVEVLAKIKFPAKKNPNLDAFEDYGLRSGRFPPVSLPEKKFLTFGSTGENIKELLGDWHKRQGYPLIEDGPHVAALLKTGRQNKTLVNWLHVRLGRMGFRLGSLLGSGAWGSVFALSDLHGSPTGLVLKITSDASEVAAAHRLLQSGIKTSAIPEILGAWGGVPGGLWMIVREDVTKTCRDRPSPKLCSVLNNFSDLDPTLFWSSRPRGGLGAQDLKALTLRDQALVNRFLKELRRIRKVTGINFIDIHKDNVRLRETPDGQKHLVITDFGFSSGPPVRVPVASNPHTAEKNPTKADLRETYKKIRISAVCYSSPSRDIGYRDFDNEVQRRASVLPESPDPWGWLALAKEVHDDAKRVWEKDRSTKKCDRCNGTGSYGWGAFVNGKPTHSGPCFRCGGTGRQNAEDMRRNCYYDIYGIPPGSLH